MGQYEVKHQADGGHYLKRTCRIKPEPDICKECRRDAEIYRYSINCQKCNRDDKRYEIVQVGVGTGIFGADFAIVRDGDTEMTVPLTRVRDIQEEWV